MYCSIVIPTISRADVLTDTLDSLSLQSERDFETIVVCDGDDERTRTLAARYNAAYPIDWIFCSRNRGPASARNLGAQKAQGEILLFLDDDCLPVPHWLSCHCKHHRQTGSNSDIVIVGRYYETYLHPFQSSTERVFRETEQQSLKDHHAHSMRMGRDLSWFPHCGMNSSIRRDAFWAAGGYDAALRVAEVADLGTRLLRRGMRLIYEPHALVIHRNPKNLCDFQARSAKRHGQADVYRVREKRQYTTQTQRLLRLHRTKGAQRIKEQLAWQCPSVMHRVGEFCRSITDLTGSLLFFRIWHSVISASAYWEGVKSEGVTRTSLRKLIGSPLPVLLFHSISNAANQKEREYHISSPRFRQFMQWLSDTNYKSTTPLELLSGPIDTKKVMITFDDGYEDFYWEGFPCLQQHGLSATVFVVVGRIGATNSWDEKDGFRSRRLLSVTQLRELQHQGLTLGSHSLTHPWLPALSDADLRREVVNSKLRLEDLLGSEVTCFAYPSGGMDARVRSAVAKAGYKMGMSLKSGLSIWDDPLSISRIDLSENDFLSDFVSKVVFGRSYRQAALARLPRILRNGPFGLLSSKI